MPAMREMLNEDETGAPVDPAWPGLARELARMNLSLNFYTQWYWKTDLHNLMHFLALRADPHAQYEIRAYAEAMLGTMQRWVPLAHAAFLEYRMNAASISATGLKVIQRMLAGETVEQKDSGLQPARMARTDGRIGSGPSMSGARILYAALCAAAAIAVADLARAEEGSLACEMGTQKWDPNTAVCVPRQPSNWVGCTGLPWSGKGGQWKETGIPCSKPPPKSAAEYLDATRGASSTAAGARC